MDSLSADDIANDRGRWGSSALFLYEILITMDQEIEFVWRTEWSLPKVLYLISRYIGLGTSVLTTLVSTFDNNNGFCRIFNPIQYMFVIITLLAPDALLLIRVRAMYGQEVHVAGIPQRCIRVGLLVVYGALVALQLALTIMEYKLSIYNSIPKEADNFGCLSASGLPDWSYSVSTVAVLFFNSLLFSLTMIKVAPSWAGKSVSSLSTLLVRDGSVYYGLVLTTSALLAIMPFKLTSRPGIELAALPWSLALSPIAACRLYLNLKSMGRRDPIPTQDGTTHDPFIAPELASAYASKPRRGGWRGRFDESTWDSEFEMSEYG